MVNISKSLCTVLLAAALIAGASGCAAQPAAEPPQPSSSESATAQEDLAAAQAEIERLQAEVDALRQSAESEPEQSAEKETAQEPEPAPAANTPATASSVPAPPATPASAPAPAASQTAPATNGTGIFTGYNVTVNDKTTPAVRSGGTDWPITTYYFIAADGTKLGSITGKAYEAICRSNQDTLNALPGGSDSWFADAFNEYRGIGGASAGGSASNTPPPSSGFDAAALSSEAFALVNKERLNAGSSEVSMDSAMMELAAMRAVELAQKYSHERPNGSRMSIEYSYAEINNRLANTAAVAVSSWIGSADHKAIMLADKYSFAGIGCYKADDGTVYWCMLFSK